MQKERQRELFPDPQKYIRNRSTNNNIINYLLSRQIHRSVTKNTFAQRRKNASPFITQQKILKTFPRRLITPFSMLMPYVWRGYLITLGFSKDGEFLITYRADYSVLEFWRVNIPMLLSLEVKPVFSCPLPICTSPSLRHNQLNVLQSPDLHLLVLIASSNFDDGDSKEYSIIIAPSPAGNEIPPAKIKILQFSYFATPPFPEVTLDHLCCLGGSRYLLVLNTGDTIRFLEVCVIQSNMAGKAKAQACSRFPFTGDMCLQHQTRCHGLKSSSFVSPIHPRKSSFRPSKMAFPGCQSIDPDPRWWDYLDRLESESKWFRQKNWEDKNNLSASIETKEEHSLDVDCFLDCILRRLGFADVGIVDYDVRIIKVLNTKHHVLLSVGISLAQPRRNETTRPPDIHNIKACTQEPMMNTVGFVFALDWISGVVIFLRRMIIAPPSSPTKRKSDLAPGTIHDKINSERQYLISVSKCLAKKLLESEIFPIHASQLGVHLNNDAVLKGKSVPFLINPVLPLAISNDVISEPIP